MAKEYARSFYASKEWQAVREYCLKRDHYACTKCGAPAEEVHHIIHISPNNIGDVKITLNADNLASLCRDCHCKEHNKDRAKGNTKKPDVLVEIEFNENGDVIRKG